MSEEKDINIEDQIMQDKEFNKSYLEFMEKLKNFMASQEGTKLTVVTYAMMQVAMRAAISISDGDKDLIRKNLNIMIDQALNEV